MNIIHGKVYDLPIPVKGKKVEEGAPTYKVIPTFHPSYFLQKENKALHARVTQDFRQAQSILSGTPGATIYNASYTLCDTLEKVEAVAKELAASTAFAFDTESPKLGFHTCPMLCYSLSLGKDRNYIVPIYKHDPNGAPWKIKAVFKDTEVEKVHDLLSVPFEDRQRQPEPLPPGGVNLREADAGQMCRPRKCAEFYGGSRGLAG